MGQLREGTEEGTGGTGERKKMDQRGEGDMDGRNLAPMVMSKSRRL